MKKLLILIQCLIISLSLFSQNEISASFNSTHSGKNIVASYSKYLNSKNEIGGGVRFNINSYILPDDQNNIYYKRLFATEPLHYFGIQGFYHRHVFQNLQHIKPFVFYDAQATYSTTINKFTGEIQHFGPYWWIEQCIGLGFKVDVANSFFITQKIGVGYSLIVGSYENSPSMLKNVTGEFGFLLNAGVGYRF